jgi:hypothetical protein
VAGVRYFQCEARRGVFSRLTRLTRTSLQQSDDSGNRPSLPRPTNGTASGITSPVRRLTPIASPSGSVKDLRLKKSTSPSLSKIIVLITTACVMGSTLWESILEMLMM